MHRLFFILLTIYLGLNSFLLQAAVQNYGQTSKTFISSQSNLWVKKAEEYLNNIQNLVVDFTQNNPDGSVSLGTFSLARPDKMRIEYRKPNNLVIISDGKFLIQYDPELNESSRADIELTPSAIFLTDPVVFTGDVNVKQVKELKDTVLITVAKQGADDLGSLTFEFKRYPFDLIGWRATDINGQLIKVNLSKDKKRPAALNYSLFVLAK